MRSIKQRAKAFISSAVKSALLEREELALKDIAKEAQRLALKQSAHYVSTRMDSAHAFDTKWQVLDHAIKHIPNVPGIACEFGVYKGETLRYIGKRSQVKCYGFDSFTGLPEDWRTGFPAGTFDMGGDLLTDLPGNVELIQGLFSDTVARFASQIDQSITLVHIDCDLYTSTLDALNGISTKLHREAVVVFDEYFGYPGWKLHEHKAWREFTQDQGISYRYLSYNRLSEQVAVKLSGFKASQ